MKWVRNKVKIASRIQALRFIFLSSLLSNINGDGGRELDIEYIGGGERVRKYGEDGDIYLFFIASRAQSNANKKKFTELFKQFFAEASL